MNRMSSAKLDPSLYWKHIIKKITSCTHSPPHLSACCLNCLHYGFSRSVQVQGTLIISWFVISILVLIRTRSGCPTTCWPVTSQPHSANDFSCFVLLETLCGTYSFAKFDSLDISGVPHPLNGGKFQQFNFFYKKLKLNCFNDFSASHC